MYFHGGGWVPGDRDTHDRLVRELSYKTGSVVRFQALFYPLTDADFNAPSYRQFADFKILLPTRKFLYI